MEEPGEQCTVVFALIVKESASVSASVCVKGVEEGGGEVVASCFTPSPPTSRFSNILCKDDIALFSMFLHALKSSGLNGFTTTMHPYHFPSH